MPPFAWNLSNDRLYRIQEIHDYIVFLGESWLATCNEPLYHLHPVVFFETMPRLLVFQRDTLVKMGGGGGRGEGTAKTIHYSTIPIPILLVLDTARLLYKVPASSTL